MFGKFVVAAETGKQINKPEEFNKERVGFLGNLKIVEVDIVRLGWIGQEVPYQGYALAAEFTPVEMYEGDKNNPEAVPSLPLLSIGDNFWYPDSTLRIDRVKQT